MLRSGSNHHYRRCRRVVSLTSSAVAAASFYGILCLKTRRWIEKLSGLIAILFFVVAATVLILLLVTGRPLKLTSIRRMNYCVHTPVNRTDAWLFNQKGCTISLWILLLPQHQLERWRCVKKQELGSSTAHTREFNNRIEACAKNQVVSFY